MRTLTTIFYEKEGFDVKKSKVLALALSFVMALSMTSVPVDAAKKVNVKKVTVESSLSGDKKTVVIAKGKSVKLKSTVTVKPAKKANKKVSYSVANKKIATVTSKGVVKGKKVGSTTITVTSSKNKGKKAKIKVKVYAKPVQKVTLDKTSGALTIGQTDALTAKVKAKKGACKKVAFVSSNAAVATVSKKGVVSAVGEGTAVITARAIDGSKKKATYTVTVTNPINLAAMDVLNAQSVTFALDKPLALTADKVNIKRKQYQPGTYNNTLKINSLTTSDNVNYTAVVDNDSKISVGDYVQVEIPTLTGEVKSAEKQYLDEKCAFTDEEISSWYVGRYRKDSFYFGEHGYSSYAISGVPAGLTAEVKDDRLVVKGVPTAAGKVDATLTATDELGNTLTKTIHFIVGDENTIVGAANQVNALLGTEAVSLYGTAQFIGGKGYYKYKVSDPSGIVTSYVGKDGEISSPSVSIKVAAAGTYKVTVSAISSEDANQHAEVDLIFNVKQGISVGGVLKDAQGNPMSAGIIAFTNKNRGSQCSTYRSILVNSETSTYSAILEPGTYDIAASYAISYYYDDENYYVDSSDGDEYTLSTKYLYAQALNETKTGYDIQLENIYKVVLASNNKDIDPTYEDWYFNHVKVGRTSNAGVIYLKNGTYSLETGELVESTGSSRTGDWFNGWTETYNKKVSYKYTTSFTVNGAAVQANVQKQVISETPGYTSTMLGAKDTSNTLSVGTYNTLNSLYDRDAESVVYVGAFTPSEAGAYKFTTSAGYDSGIYVYDMAGIAQSKDTDGYYSLKAGAKYIVKASYNYSVNITKFTTPSPSTPDNED